MCRELDISVHKSRDIDAYKLREYAECTGWNLIEDTIAYSRYEFSHDPSAIIVISDNAEELWGVLTTLSFFNHEDIDSILSLVSGS